MNNDVSTMLETTISKLRRTIDVVMLTNGALREDIAGLRASLETCCHDLTALRAQIPLIEGIHARELAIGRNANATLLQENRTLRDAGDAPPSETEAPRAERSRLIQAGMLERRLQERRRTDPKFLGCDFDRFTLSYLTVVRYGAEGHYVTRLLRPRAEPYVVMPSTFAIHDMVPNTEKAAHAMPDGTPFDIVILPAMPAMREMV